MEERKLVNGVRRVRAAEEEHISRLKMRKKIHSYPHSGQFWKQREDPESFQKDSKVSCKSNWQQQFPYQHSMLGDNGRKTCKVLKGSNFQGRISCQAKLSVTGEVEERY